MSKFEELLNQPLPSAIMGGDSEPMFESFNEFDIDDVNFDESDNGLDDFGTETTKPGGGVGKDSNKNFSLEGGCSKENECGECGDACVGCEDRVPVAAPSADTINPIGIGPVSFTMPDEPVADVEIDEPVPAPVDVDVEVEPVPLTPDQDKRVDNVMDTVGTNILIKNELNDEQLKEFTESIDVDILEKEGLITERTIIKFDKYARRAQLYEVAVAACAREHKDPLYKKLQTAYKIERTIKARLRRKYHGEANRKVKEYLARARKSKSGILSRIAAKLSGGKKK